MHKMHPSSKMTTGSYVDPCFILGYFLLITDVHAHLYECPNVRTYQDTYVDIDTHVHTFACMHPCKGPWSVDHPQGHLLLLL